MFPARRARPTLLHPRHRLVCWLAALALTAASACAQTTSTPPPAPTVTMAPHHGGDRGCWWWSRSRLGTSACSGQSQRGQPADEPVPGVEERRACAAGGEHGKHNSIVTQRAEN